MDMICTQALLQTPASDERHDRSTQGVVLVVSDDAARVLAMASICEFLDLEVRMVTAEMDLATMLRVLQPLAVIADAEGPEQDGFYAMKVVARFNRGLPMLLLTDGDPVMMGAADATQLVFGLHEVTVAETVPSAGEMIEFLFNAGRATGCMRLVPV